ncbi:hypothetical protein QMP26_41845 (plasmid) [Enterocloster clostridioformis]
MNTKEITLENMYLIRHHQGYYHGDKSAFYRVKETATRFLNRDIANKAAACLHGEVEEEETLPRALNLITATKKLGLTGGQSICRIMDGLFRGDRNSIDYDRKMTLGGRTANSEDVIFTAAGRYADILNAAHNIIDSYYELIASDNYYSKYDPELDNSLGLYEIEIYYQLSNLYEQQLESYAVIYYAAAEYLMRALICKFAKRADAYQICRSIIILFSDKVIESHQMDPYKCYEQFKLAEQQFYAMKSGFLENMK